MFCPETHHSELEVGVASDLWRGRRGLGKTRYRLWATLPCRDRWTVAELAEAVGLSRQAVLRSLEVLRPSGTTQQGMAAG
jgi:predicted ArsR family transcriptional regulator